MSEHDPEVAEDYAASVGADPTPEEIDTYLRLEGAPPLADQAAHGSRGAAPDDGAALTTLSPAPTD
jgi:hypothetical protein